MLQHTKLPDRLVITLKCNFREKQENNSVSLAHVPPVSSSSDWDWWHSESMVEKAKEEVLSMKGLLCGHTHPSNHGQTHI